MRRPEWLRIQAPSPSQAEGIRRVRSVLEKHRLHTVCQGAICPNAVECWGAKTASFMILGETCTRACRFCGVPTGDPRGQTDPTEPTRLADAVAELELDYVVLTSVDRDDLEDGGAGIYAEAVARIRAARPGVRVELLIPDFSGDPRLLNRVLHARADVVGHNMETVRSLSKMLRDRRAGYDQSLAVLSYLRNGSTPDQIRIKTGLMLGLGETIAELRETFADLVAVGVDGLTLGQYLRPRPSAVAAKRFVEPPEFEELAREARAAGIRYVVAGPLVRSSYGAAALFQEP